MVFKRIHNIIHICKNKRLDAALWQRKAFVSGFKKSEHNYYQICFNNGSAFRFNYAFLDKNHSSNLIFTNDKGGMLHITISKK